MNDFRRIDCAIRCLDGATVAKVRAGLAGRAVSTVPYVCKVSGEAEVVRLVSPDLAAAVARRVDGLDDGLDALLAVAVLDAVLCECDLATLADEPEPAVLEHIARLHGAGILVRREVHGMNYYGLGSGAVRDAVAAALAAGLEEA